MSRRAQNTSSSPPFPTAVGKIFARAFIAALAAMPVAGGAHAQEAETFAEVIDVRVVNLEAVVVDRQGRRVSGLGPEDFRLLVDGREVPIEFFNEVAGGAVVAQGGRPGAERVEDVPGLEPGRPVGTSYLLFIDDYFTLPRDRNLVLDEMRDAIARLGREDRMAVVAFDGRRIDMLTTWTSDGAELQRALDRARRRPALGLQTLAQVRVLDLQARSGISRTVGLQRRVAAQELETRLERAVQAVTASMRSFARPPGRKVMLLAAGTWPYSPARYMIQDAGPVDLLSDVSRGARLLRPIWETANLLGYTLYPIDVPGPAPSAVNAADRGFPGTGEVFRDNELDTTLLVLAEETGGRAMTDGLRLDALDRAIDDTRSYYWLGFTPAWRGDDRSRSVRLEVLRPGLKVRSRSGFRDLSRSLEVSFMVESALLFGDLPGALPLEVRFGEGRRRGLGKLEVPLEVRFPMDAVTTLPRGGRYVTPLELRIAVIDERGERNEMPVIPLSLEARRPPRAGEHATYETVLQIRRRPHDVVVALHDPLSGAVLTTVERFEP